MLIVKGGVMVMENGVGADVSPALSCTVTENLEVPVPRGVPIMMPLAGFRTMPFGRIPLVTVQFLYGGVPPAAVSGCEYSANTMPLGSGFVVMVTGLVTVMENAWAGEVAPGLSWTVTLKLEVPTAVGVPLMVPLEDPRVKPLGSDPLLTVQFWYGGVPPVAARVAE